MATITAYTKSQADTLLAGKAALASPAFSGTPTAPTAPSGTASTQVATTAFVASSAASGSSSNGTTPASTATVYSSQFPYSKPAASNASLYTWVCDGVADEAEINAACAAVAAQGGGRVQLLGDTFYTGASISVPTGVWLSGEGYGTLVKATSSMSGGMVTLTDNGTHLVKITDMTIDGGGQDVTAGILFSATGGQIFTSLPPSNPDSAHEINSVFIRAIGTSTVAGYGLILRGANLRAGKYGNIRIQNATGCGVWNDGSVDSHLYNIEVGSSGAGGPAVSTSSTAPVGHGFYLSAGENNMLVACKAWYSRGTGFYVRSTRLHLSNCQAQDNYGHGFQGAYGKNSYVGCLADSNGQGGASAGFYLTSELNTVAGCVSSDRAQSGWQQTYGYQVNSGFTTSRISGCIAYGNTGGAITGTVPSSSTVDVAST